MTSDVRRTFAALHAEGSFVLPNPWDVGSARLLAGLGFRALATTSSGYAASLGKADQHVTLDELLAHVRALTAAVQVPVNVDAERCFADTPAGVAETVTELADAGAAGISLEDYDPGLGQVEPLSVAVERVGAAAEAAGRAGVVLTARAENHLYLTGDHLLDDTVERLRAYSAAGAGCVYAPGLVEGGQIARVVADAGAPVNVLALPGGPSVGELAVLGVRRVSTGGALAWVAYGALVDAARELADHGTYGYLGRALSRDVREQAFGG
jgi:2-methylisocitrate lyase-like PEP mutase family enzyme